VISSGTMYRRGKNWHANFSVDSRQIRLSLRTTDEEKAKERLEKLRLKFHKPPRPDGPPQHYPFATGGSWAETVADGLRHSGGWLSLLYQRTKDRARMKKIPFRLTKDEFRALAMQSEGRCVVTGKPFDWGRPDSCKTAPYAPTLDRIVPAIGYTATNCRIVAHAVNCAMGDWGEAVFLDIAQAALAYRRGYG
jgi:hypothetical protein